MTVYMTCPRDYTLRTTLGHTIKFEANKPTPVPDSAYQEALSKNILPVTVPFGDSPAHDFASGRITGPLRDTLVFDGIRALTTRNNSEDFTGGGMPKAQALTRETGVDVSASEVGKYWDRYKQIIAENDDFPQHPNAEMVRELNGMATRKQLEQMALDLDVDLRPLKGKSLSELKSFLLQAITTMKQAPLMFNEPVQVDDDGQQVQDYVKPDSLVED